MKYVPIISLRKPLVRVGALLIAVALLATVAACGGTTAPTVKFGDFNWSSAQIQNRIAGYIAENGYGFQVEYVPGNTINLGEAITTNDIDVAIEVWYDTMQTQWDKRFDEGLVQIGQTIRDNWQSAYVVPKYVIDANPGLRTVQDLKKPEYKQLFATIETGDKARLLTCPPGWECELTNEAQHAAYGLQDHVELVSPGSADALFPDLRGAYQRGEPWLGYSWAPTSISNELDLVRLEEPPYSEACWNDMAIPNGCAYPTVRIYIVVHPDFAERAPDLVEMLRKFELSADEASGIEKWITDNNKEPVDGARWFLETNDKWTTFVPDDVVAKVRASLAFGK